MTTIACTRWPRLMSGVKCGCSRLCSADIAGFQRKKTLQRKGRGGCAKDAKASRRLKRHRVLCETFASSAVKRGFARCALRALEAAGEGPGEVGEGRVGRGGGGDGRRVAGGGCRCPGPRGHA